MKAITHNLRISILATLAALPATAFAELPQGFPGLKALLDSLATGVVQSLGYMLLTLAVVAFFFGIVQFIWNARQGAEGKGMQKGKQFMMWGLIGIFVMFSVWGIIQFAQNVLGIQGYNTITVPSLDFRRDGSSANPGSGSAFVPAGSGGAYNQTQQAAAQTYASCISGGVSVATCEQRYQQAGGTGGSYAATQTNAQQVYNNCIGNGGTQASCQQQYQTAGGQGSGTQGLAQQAYNTCIGNGNTASECQAAYTAYGGAGSGQQNLAQQAYNTCIGNGNSSTECQAAYAQYGGTGSGAQNLAQDAYSLCLGNGNSAAECQGAYTSYGGTGTPTTQANSNGQCPAGYVADDSSSTGCSRVGGGTSAGYTGDNTAAGYDPGYGGSYGDSTAAGYDPGYGQSSTGSMTPDEALLYQQGNDYVNGGSGVTGGWDNTPVLETSPNGDIQYAGPPWNEPSEG